MNNTPEPLRSTHACVQLLSINTRDAPPASPAWQMRGAPGLSIDAAPLAYSICTPPIRSPAYAPQGCPAGGERLTPGRAHSARPVLTSISTLITPERPAHQRQRVRVRPAPPPCTRANPEAGSSLSASGGSGGGRPPGRRAPSARPQSYPESGACASVPAVPARGPVTKSFPFQLSK